MVSFFVVNSIALIFYWQQTPCYSPLLEGKQNTTSERKVLFVNGSRGISCRVLKQQLGQLSLPVLG